MLQQVDGYAQNVQGGVLAGSGHWLPEERPTAFLERLLAFLGAD